VLMQDKSCLEGTDKQQTIEDTSNREKKLAVLEREHTDLLEKLKLSFVEVANLQNELKTSDKKYISAQRELEILCQALEATQTDNSRLHRESEFVAANVNQWIKEQKLANENLGEKIREQNQLLAHLTEERDNFQKKEEALLALVTNFKADLEKMKTENEQLKENGAEQQELNIKLRRQLETQELEHTSLFEKNLAATEDMHSKLQTNIKSIHFLNQKLNELGQENGYLRQQLEDGKLRCQQYERHLETCNQTLSNLFTHLKVIQEQRDCLQEKTKNVVSCSHNIVPPLTTGSHAQLQIFSQKGTVNGESEELVLKDSFEKSCRTHCTEHSTPLQDNTEYWMEKMNGLMLQIQQCIGTRVK
ncbi:PREDICTED: protein CROWDED NUCLEI 3-like, partial [Nanorana parkeri]|uniref:protein CROWDED NUCLEI 3-like n=1 Tax=Nanorana parkeri TaxID=125878 RepID=UPI000854E196